MNKKKIVIIDDNVKFQTVLHYLFLDKKIYEVVALLTHDEAVKNAVLQKANIAIVAVKSTEQKTLETVRFAKDKYSLKILALPLYIRDALVNELKHLKVEGILSKNCIDQDNVHEALDEISEGGKYYNLIN